MPSNDSLTDQASALIRLANRRFRSVSPKELERRWLRLRKRGACDRARARPSHRRFAALASVFAMVAAIVVYMAVGRTKRLSYEFDGTRPVTQDCVETKTDERSVLRFSDGSDVALEPEARMRLVSVDAGSPRLVLEKGEAGVHVFHRDGVHWRFDAGPFLILVNGTSFVVRWDEKEKEFYLRLRSGSVTVTGPLTSGGVEVRAGQVWSARLKEGESVLREERTEPVSPPTVSSVTAPPLAPPPAAVREKEARPAPSDRRPAEGTHNWNRMLAAGKVSQVLAEADALGIESVLESAGPSDLEALGDAARYSGRDDVGRNALLACRRRFSNSHWSARAAFFLGRIDSTAGNWSSSLSWYETYLREAATGTYVAEALGGRMTAVRHAQGSEAARPIAREYLHRFPNGSDAAAARTLINQPP